jgi:hypothetical protein
MNSRKAKLITVKTGGVGTSPGRFAGETCQATLLSAACEDCRLIGGWSSWEAGVFNAGTSPGDVKRKVSSGRPARAKVSMRLVRGGVTRSSVESRGNPEGAKGWPPLLWFAMVNKVRRNRCLGGTVE